MSKDLLLIGPLSQWPISAWPHFFLDTMEMRYVWCVLWGDTPKGKHEWICDNKLHTITFKVTHLIDEAFNVAKGLTPSIPCCFFASYGLGESSIHLHANNCAGQNKNRFMMYYQMWRIFPGLHKKVKISFLIVWHAKFSPNWCFGLMEQHFYWNKIEDLDNIANFISLSSVNVLQLVDSLDGTTFIST